MHRIAETGCCVCGPDCCWDWGANMIWTDWQFVSAGAGAGVTGAATGAGGIAGMLRYMGRGGMPTGIGIGGEATGTGTLIGTGMGQWG